jgi:hypothetical protein
VNSARNPFADTILDQVILDWNHLRYLSVICAICEKTFCRHSINFRLTGNDLQGCCVKLRVIRLKPGVAALLPEAEASGNFLPPFPGWEFQKMQSKI